MIVERKDRRKRMKYFRQNLAVLTALLLILAPASFASTASNTVTVPVLLNIPESVSLTTNSGGITLTNAAPTQTITLTAAWQIKSGHTNAKIYSWFSVLPTGGSGLGPIPSFDFSTSFNGGSAVVCNQPAFGGGIGVGSQSCGSFTLTQNVASDFNDSVPVSFSLTAAPATFNLTPGTYNGGVLNLLLQIS
jgi:hypothetical protein